MKRSLSLGVLCVFFASVAATAQTKEILYSNDEFKKLDTFEAHSLAKADRVFGKKEYKRAAAEYDSFILEFPKSKAIAYALLRKGRCLHLAKKRFLAIKEYDEILDYFPNDVKYAAAALYSIGQCHWENGDEEKALKAWADMAKDVDYRKTRLAAKAIKQLADNLAKRDQIGRA
ncbi:MAG: tetratricopeptide repeat protein, partial [Planctomycetes bacterium]|nr:tetratricopeptide repeat protein [Planctomycetota bacterium]